jgi:hypothetical protein
MKKFSMVLSLALFSLLITKAQSISGTWVFSNANVNLTMLLNSDGSGEFQGQPIRYRVQNGQLYIDDGVKPVVYNYKLTQNSLILSGGEMQMAVTFTRPGGVSESPSGLSAAANQNQPQNQYQNAEQANNRPSPGQPDIPANKPNPMFGQTTTNSANSGLKGIWEGAQGKLVFYPDGSMLYNNTSYNYSVSGTNMTIGGSDGSIVFTFNLLGTSLTLSQNGSSTQYSKTSNLKAEVVDQQLAGKWCIVSGNYNNYSGGGSSSEECITLNPDGTYIYSYSAERSGYAANQSVYGGTSNQSGDRGTWKTDGTTISSYSQTSGKSTRYSLSKENAANGDPMIVIGGKKFVTAYNRPRW